MTNLFNAPSDRLRLTIVSETWFPQINGVSRTLDRLVRYLGGLGDKIQIIIPRYATDVDGNASPLRDDAGDVDLVSFPAAPLPIYRDVMIVAATPAMIGRRLARFNPDLVHIATEGPLGWAALMACRDLGLPVVSSYHTNFPQYCRFYGLGAAEPLIWRYLCWFHNATAMTFCPTHSIAETLREKGIDRVDVWGRGVDVALFHPGKGNWLTRRRYRIAPEEIVLAYVGRLASEKNLEMLMEAFRILPDKPPSRLILIGGGPLRDQLEQNADTRVIFTGYQHGEDLARLFASADIFVFPSLTETFGNVTLEAMASGLPVVGFIAPGIRDVVQHEVTGLLAGETSAVHLADAVTRLMSDDLLRRRMSLNAREFSLRQTWEQVLSRLRQSYTEVLGRQHKQAGQPSPAPKQRRLA